MIADGTKEINVYTITNAELVELAPQRAFRGGVIISVVNGDGVYLVNDNTLSVEEAAANGFTVVSGAVISDSVSSDPYYAVAIDADSRVEVIEVI